MAKVEASPIEVKRLLKISSCPSLSGRSELTYHIGSNAEGAIHFRVVGNTGPGQFNADWVASTLIEKHLSAHLAGNPMSSAVLQSIFRGKSSNSPAFLFAVLKAESLVVPGADTDSGYLIGDFNAFRQAMYALVASDTNVDSAVTSSPEPAKRKRSKEQA